MTQPFFSILIPAYNRAFVIGRALTSCLTQSFGSFEIVVVDDGSTDDLAGVVRAFDDRRIRLIAHERNCGRGPARNTAMSAARGEWFVFLDSDDELLPGALEAIHRRAVAADPAIRGLRFMCVDDQGPCPNPPHRDEIVDYEHYLRWLDLAERQETLPCVRASSYPSIQYTESHASERWYHLELARTSLVQFCSDIVRRYHQDVTDRITAPTPRRSLRYAPDEADDARKVLAVHGEALERFAPATYWQMIVAAITASFLSGRRIDGLRHAVKVWRREPFSLRLYVVVALGLLDRRLLAWTQAVRARIIRARAASR